MCFRSPAKTPVPPCVARASTQTPLSLVVVPIGSAGNAVASFSGEHALSTLNWVKIWMDVPREVLSVGSTFISARLNSLDN